MIGRSYTDWREEDNSLSSLWLLALEWPGRVCVGVEWVWVGVWVSEFPLL